MSYSSCKATTATAAQYINFKNGTNANTSLPLSAQILYNEGKELFDENKYEQAISYFDRALAAEPNNINALNGKADAYVRTYVSPSK